MRGAVIGLPLRTMINHAARPSVKTIKAIYSEVQKKREILFTFIMVTMFVFHSLQNGGT